MSAKLRSSEHRTRLLDFRIKPGEKKSCEQLLLSLRTHFFYELLYTFLILGLLTVRLDVVQPVVLRFEKKLLTVLLSSLKGNHAFPMRAQKDNLPSKRYFKPIIKIMSFVALHTVLNRTFSFTVGFPGFA